MNTQTRSQKILNFIQRGVFGTVIVILLSAIAGIIYQIAATEADQRNIPASGSLIDVRGFKMHIHCEGQGLSY